MVAVRGGLPDRLDDHRMPGRASGFLSGNQRSAAGLYRSLAVLGPRARARFL